jgi:transcriptional regulator with XRE-family HTH domain
MESQAHAPDSRIRRFIAERRATEPRYSVTALAKACGCNRQLIYRVLAGDPEVGKNTFERIEAATGIPAEDLYSDWLAAKKRRPAETDTTDLRERA